MDYRFSEDIRIIREITGMSQAEIASALGFQQVTISRNELGITKPSSELLEKLYGFAFSRGIRLGLIKEMLWRENTPKGHILLFHGAKDIIDGNICIDKGRTNNDFGKGFYTGENYNQAISFISAFSNSSVYYLDFDSDGLSAKKYYVNQDWLLTIAYYRGVLEKYAEHPIVSALVEESRNSDYIIAPIADNRMFQIINSFIEGEITDEQCKHCLSASNLGNQYVFTSEKAVERISILEKGYVSEKERKHYMDQKAEDVKLGDDKVKTARIKYRGKGLYIDEILK